MKTVGVSRGKARGKVISVTLSTKLLLHYIHLRERMGCDALCCLCKQPKIHTGLLVITQIHPCNNTDTCTICFSEMHSGTIYQH